MLVLENIVKEYAAGTSKIEALAGVSLSFRKNEFVSILGPSGCGKTTMLNIVGGLDRYTSGDLIINGKSTKDFKAYEWDAYRNRSIGFVFQSYNLIPHLSVLGNVEMALTLSGISKHERKERATAALADVGLTDQLHKRPNQLSGGQMQRVAIARALVNNPDIILADEPTGALDSTTSVQIMELLKVVAEKRLVIMVTHNGDLAEQYSTRIIKLLDGKLQSDSNPIVEEPVIASNSIPDSNEAIPKIGASNREIASSVGAAGPSRNDKAKPKRNKTSMSYITALSLSLKNLLTKKGRTFITAFAGSIGIIGVALVLAVSFGFNAYIASAQTDTLAEMPIQVNRSVMDFRSYMNHEETTQNPSDAIYPYTPPPNNTHHNVITQGYVDHVNDLDSALYTDIRMRYGLEMNFVAEAGTNYNSFRMRELSSRNTENERIYEVLAGNWPAAANELVLVLDSNNRIMSDTLNQLGIANTSGTPFAFSEVLGKNTYRLIPNDAFYQTSGGGFAPKTVDGALYAHTSAVPLTIVGVVKIKNADAGGMLDMMDMVSGSFNSSTGLAFSPMLTQARLAAEATSNMAIAATTTHLNNFLLERRISFGESTVTFPAGSVIIPALSYMKLDQQRQFGANTTPASIRIFPKDFDSKTIIKEHLAAWNASKAEADQILFSDLAETITNMMATVVDAISYVLIAFAAISLVVSSIMIGIITYVSVIERTREIGVLRALGGRKKDIRRVFNAETLIIGFTAGVIGVAVTLILTLPINLIINFYVPELHNVAQMAWWHPIALIGGSMVLTFIAGLFPANAAAKKDPVVALRTE